MNPVRRARNRHRSVARDIVIATGTIVALYGLAVGVQFQPIQIPGFLLILGFDALEGLFGSAGNYYDVLFAVYIFGLGVGSGVVAHILRRKSAEDTLDWRSGVAGAFAVVGAFALLFAVSVFVRGSAVAPALVSAVAGIVMLAISGWLLGLIDVRFGP